MDSFGNRNVKFVREVAVRTYEVQPNIIEGADAINTLCPVSELTGHRTNALTLLGMVTDGNARLLDNILTELPAVQQMDVPDKVKIEQLVPAEFGTFAERDAVVEKLSSIADVLFKKEPAKEPSPQPASVPANPSVTTT